MSVINWRPIADAPTDGRVIWVVDSQHTIYQAQWYADDRTFVDLWGDDAGDLTHWCERDAIALPLKG